MAYTPRPLTWQNCAFCQAAFAARNTRRRYCSPSCNVRASYARTGRRSARVSPASGATELAPAAVLAGTPTPAARPVVAPPPVAPPAAAHALQLLASCRALQELVGRNLAEQAARRQLLERLLQAY